MIRFNKFSHSRAFTLIELLVVISIIALLNSILFGVQNSIREKAKIARAKQDLSALRSGFALLNYDTGRSPNGCAALGSSDSVETSLDSRWAGMLTRPFINPNSPNVRSANIDPQYSFSPGDCGWTQDMADKWSGPYVNTVIDPWGNAYFFDPDYYTYNYSDINVHIPVVLSKGPNGIRRDPIWHYYNVHFTRSDPTNNLPDPYPTDDIYLPLGPEAFGPRI